ncbi:transcriptional regulator, HxlR family [Chitinophaga sp. YR573]|uniref:winged helix-turn-helix transcriptional regulator n=1 Tax=Chitinophaga sp. YR573 TaxID=1881040 RepID=UPI0008C302C3|nr:helix-turn-helix domain-containing protein [Chitinophaga sp. YR573]SEW45385.1 transcriptional regulator, HxlR family [Chitinophaga sp. YR573]
MKENNPDKFILTSECPIRQVLDRFGDKWSMLVVELLSHRGRLRFSEIGQNIEDISQKMLTVTLRSLESDGLITREIFPEIPPRVEYELTSLGKSLVPHIMSLTSWGIEHMATILENRKAYELKQKKTTY